MIIISPWSRKLRNGKDSPKNYPYWRELVNLLNKHDNIIQIGAGDERILVRDIIFNQSLETVSKLIVQCKFWISVDNFLQHMCDHIKKPGVVMWSHSDPDIFGYNENLNILKNRKYLRSNQFTFWETCSPDIDAWYSPIEVINILKTNGLIK